MSDGLEGVVAADTVLSEVDGQAGRLIIRGRSLDELAGFSGDELRRRRRARFRSLGVLEPVKAP